MQPGAGSFTGGSPARKAARLNRKRALAIFGAMLLAVSCAQPPSNTAHNSAGADGDYASFDATRVFSAGYKDIDEIYIEKVEPSDLALAGLNRLAEIDPEIRIIRRDTHLFLDIDGNPAGTFEIPTAESGQAWGSLTAAAVNAGRQRSQSLQQASAETIYEAVFDGMLTELDDFSRYASRAEAQDNRANRDGFHGIGVRIEMVDEGIHVVAVMDQTPAAKAGLREGDVITEVDGLPTHDLTLRQAVDELRGPLNSHVRLLLKRASSNEPVMASVVREHIVPQTVAYERDGNAAYIRVSGFNQDTSRSLRRAMSTAREEIGGVLTGYIIDLRDNPGGLLDQAVAVSDLFVSGGPIVSTRGRHRDSHQFFDAEDDDLTGNLPVVVLINGRSASASEIVAAALQDSGRAVVIGSASFGKGTVQTVLRLPNDGELTLTWARFHAPSGYALHGRGVLPNVCTSDGSLNVETLIHRIASVPQRTRASNARTPKVASETEARALRATCPAADGMNDLDLQIAKRLLADHILYRQALHRNVDHNMANADFVASD